MGRLSSMQTVKLSNHASKTCTALFKIDFVHLHDNTLLRDLRQFRAILCFHLETDYDPVGLHCDVNKENKP